MQKKDGLNGTSGGFDIVIGNPPYVSIKEIPVESKQIFLKNYKTAVGQFDLYCLFIEKSIYLLKDFGMLSFITSNTFLNNKDFIELRKYLLQNTSIQSLINLDETIFETAQVDVAITILCKEEPQKDNKIKILRKKEDFLSLNFDTIEQNRFLNEENLYEFKLNCTVFDFDLIDKLYKNKILLGSIMDLPRGIEIGANSDKILTEPKQNLKKLLVGKDISRYEINFKNRYIEFDYIDKSNFKDISIYDSEKILIQRIRNLSLKQRLVCSYDNEKYLCTNTLRIGILKNNNFNIKYILGVLNSKVINYLFLKYFLNKDIYAYQLEKLPIPAITSSNLELASQIKAKVEAVLLSKQSNSQDSTTETEKEIDRLVYGLYGLTEEEIGIIENEK